MKWLGYLLSVIVSIILVVLVAAVQGPVIFLVPLYAGLFIYWTFRPTWDERIPAVKKIAVIGAMLTVVLVIESLVLQILADKAQSLGPDATPLFAAPGFLFVIGLGAIFVAIPALLAFLDGLTRPDREGLARNPLLVLAYVVLTLGIYQIYWFWLIKKGLRNSDIQTASLWWFLFPVIGTILIYISFSKALEQRTQRKFIIWFLIFFFINGLDVVINQAILNHDLLKQRA